MSDACQAGWSRDRKTALRVAASDERQRDEPLRQIAVLGIQPVVVERPVAVAGGDVYELVVRAAVMRDGEERHRDVEQTSGDDRRKRSQSTGNGVAL